MVRVKFIAYGRTRETVDAGLEIVPRIGEQVILSIAERSTWRVEDVTHNISAHLIEVRLG